MPKFKVEHKFDPFELVGYDKGEFSKSDRKEILDRVSEFVIEQILSDVGDLTSPVTGKRFDKLDKDYKHFKEEEGLPGKPDLTFSGDMLDAIKAEVVGSKVRIAIDDPEQAAKAYGHNTGFEGHPTIKDGPERKFIPMPGESFAKSVKDGIEEIMKDYLSGPQS